MSRPTLGEESIVFQMK